MANYGCAAQRDHLLLFSGGTVTKTLIPISVSKHEDSGESEAAEDVASCPNHSQDANAGSATRTRTERTVQ